MSPSSRVASEQRIVHRRPPTRWRDGFPLGNGDLGAMVWGDGAPLAITLDKVDLWDRRFNAEHRDDPLFNYTSLVELLEQKQYTKVDEVFEKREERNNPVSPTKVSIGRAELDMGEAVRYECALDLGTATVTGIIETESGTYDLQGFVHHDRNVLCLRVSGLEPEVELKLVPLAEMALPPDMDGIDLEPGEVRGPVSLIELGYPKPQVYDEGPMTTLVQQIPGGVAYAVTWNRRGTEFFLAAESADTPQEAAARAQDTWRRAVADGLDALHAEHTNAWDAFWSTSAVYLPEKRIEFLWYHGLYMMASSRRRGALPAGLQGVWAMDGVMPPWRGDYHADMNIQESYWAAAPSGHLDLLDNWCDYMKECIKPAREFTQRFFGTEGTFWPCCTVPGHTIVPCWHTVQFAWSHSGWLAWLVWLRWRYSMDAAWLSETGYSIVADIFKFYRANLREEQDGHLHIPISSSPEYADNTPAGWAKDPNIDIALIRRCCDWVIEMEKALGKSDLASAAEEVHEKLVPYSLTEKNELCLWPGKPLDEFHRHPSHLMAVHPAMDLTVDDDEEARKIIRASFEHYCSLGLGLWGGNTCAQVASMAAVLRRSELAYDCLSHFANYCTGPNGMYALSDSRRREGARLEREVPPFTLDANCSVAAGVCDMLVQGWRDVLRIFPAVPLHWRDVAFRDLLVEGAFRVSALRRDSGTVWVRVVAGVGRELCLHNPFGDAAIRIEGGQLRRSGDMLIGHLREGQQVTIQLEDVSCDFEREAMLARQSDTSRIGLR